MRIPYTAMLPQLQIAPTAAYRCVGGGAVTLNVAVANMAWTGEIWWAVTPTGAGGPRFAVGGGVSYSGGTNAVLQMGTNPGVYTVTAAPRGVAPLAATATVVILKVEIEEIASRPNHPEQIALNDEYRAQQDVVQVFEAWKVRYKAKSSPSGIVASFKWQRRPHGTDAIWADIGMESILEHTEDTAGDFDVRVVGVTSSGEVPSDVRRIFIVQLNPQAPTQVMALHVLGSYAYVPDPPEGGPYTISFEGSLSALTSTPPDIGDMKLKWGWIQGAKMSANSAHYVFHHLEWFANAQQGVTAQFWKENRYDLPEPETEYHNDAFDSNSYLYASGSPFGLGEASDAKDGPGFVYLQSDLPSPSHQGSFSRGYWDLIAAQSSFISSYRLWQVVLNIETHQYVPINQQDWSLSITPGSGPSYPQPLGQPAAATTKPTEPSSWRELPRREGVGQPATLTFPDTTLP